MGKCNGSKTALELAIDTAMPILGLAYDESATKSCGDGLVSDGCFYVNRYSDDPELLKSANPPSDFSITQIEFEVFRVAGGDKFELFCGGEFVAAGRRVCSAWGNFNGDEKILKATKKAAANGDGGGL